MPKVNSGLDVAKADFATKRGVVEAPNMQAVLAAEGSQEVVHARCVVGDVVCNLRPAEFLL